MEYAILPLLNANVFNDLGDVRDDDNHLKRKTDREGEVKELYTFMPKMTRSSLKCRKTNDTCLRAPCSPKCQTLEEEKSKKTQN